MCFAAGSTGAVTLSVQVWDDDSPAANDRHSTSTVTIPSSSSSSSGTATSTSSYTVYFSYSWQVYSVGCGQTRSGNTAASTAVNANGQSSADHYYAFTAPYAGVFTLSTCGSAIDTVVAVWRAGGSPGGVGSRVGSCDDSGCSGSLTSTNCASTRETVRANLGQGNWVIQVEGYSSNEGAYQLQVQCATLAPTRAPTRIPTRPPTRSPTRAPSRAPTTRPPSNAPTPSPTRPACQSSHTHTCNLTSTLCVTIPGSFLCACNQPAGFTERLSESSCGTAAPTATPTSAPSPAPSAVPTANPTQSPLAAPTLPPTARPTKPPTVAPTAAPTESPTFAPVVAAGSTAGSDSVDSATTLIVVVVVVVVMLAILLAIAFARRRREKHVSDTMPERPMTYQNTGFDPSASTTDRVGTLVSHYDAPADIDAPQYGTLGPKQVVLNNTYSRLHVEGDMVYSVPTEAGEPGTTKKPAATSKELSTATTPHNYYSDASDVQGVYHTPSQDGAPAASEYGSPSDAAMY